jgi:hypothetical protein
MFKDGSLVPPPWAVRSFFVAFTVLMLVRLRSEHDAGAIATAAFFTVIAVGNTFGARALNDGRVEAWSKSHPVLNAAAVFLLFSVGCFGVMTDFLSERTSLLIALAVGVCMVIVITVRGRTRT